MKETKPMIKKLGALLSAALCMALILSCSPLFEAPAEADGGSGETGRVVLRVSAGGTDSGPARTVLPTTVPKFSRYELVFSRDGAAAITVSDTARIEGEGVSQELIAGAWEATVTAYRKFTVTGGQEKEYEAARGSSAITVAAGKITPITVNIEPLPVEGTTEKGIFTYTVNFPAGVTKAELTFGSETPPLALISGRKASVEKAPGYYDLFILLEKGGLSAGYAEKVHIYAGLDSAAVFDFKDDDFVESVYLAGTLSLPVTSVSGGTVNAYSDAEYTAQIGTASIPAGDGSWVIGIPASSAVSVVYLKAVVTGSDGKTYTPTGSTSGATPEKGAEGIVLTGTPAPGEVSGLKGQTFEGGQVELTWADPADAGLDRIEISWTSGGVGGGPVTVGKSSNGNRANSKIIENLANGTAYTFTLKAVDKAGNKSAGKIIKSVSLKKASLTLAVGTTETLIATVVPDDTRPVIWSSDKPGVATVINGAITAVAFSTARITVTTGDGAYTASCTVTVIPITVSTLAGSGTLGFANGSGTAATFNYPIGVAVDSGGNVYVADKNNHRIRKITPAGVVSTFAGSGTEGFLNGTGTAAQFNHPIGVAVDSEGNVYVADTYNHRIRKITPQGVVSTFAGNGTEGFADGTGTAAQFYNPAGVAVDGAGNVYVADTYNHRIRKITPQGEVSTLAGSGTEGFADGTGTAAQFRGPIGVAVDGEGNVYVADESNHRIRKITPAGEVSTFAGSGTEGFLNGTGTTAQFNHPSGVALDSDGNVYVADESNHRIRKITITTHPAGPVKVEFSLPRDETITLSQSNTLSWKAETPLTVNVSGTFDAYRWALDGKIVAGKTGSSLTLNAGTLSVKSHRLTVLVMKGGVQYAKELIFTVWP
jgi:sugar lactone lactonase YvrE